MTKWKDSETGLEVILGFVAHTGTYNYYFRSNDGEETEVVSISNNQALLNHVSQDKKESYLGINLLRDEVKRRRETKLKEMSPLERAQKILVDKWPYNAHERTLEVLGCIVEHLIAIDKPK